MENPALTFNKKTEDTKKRLLSILLTVYMVLTLMPCLTQPAKAAYSPTIYMTLDGKPMSPTVFGSAYTTLFAYIKVNNLLEFQPRTHCLKTVGLSSLIKIFLQ